MDAGPGGGRRLYDPNRLGDLFADLLEGTVSEGAIQRVRARLATVMTVNRVCERLGVKPSTVRNYVRTGKLRRVTDGATTLFLPEDVESFEASRATEDDD